MDCRNHPGLEAVGRCAGCAELYCSHCLINVQGQSYCGSCRVMAMPPPHPLGYAGPTGHIPCKEAGEALTIAIIGIFLFGIILEPIALVKAAKAKKMIRANPYLTGAGKATAAQIIAGIALVLSVIGLIGLMSK